MMQSDHNIFISYSSKDQVIVRQIYRHLENNNLRCWIAPRNIQPGQSWAGSIMKAIRTTKVFLLILTNNSNNSAQVMREVERAVNQDLPIVCLWLEELSLSDDLEYFISSIHWIPAYDKPLDEVQDNLQQVIELHLSGQPNLQTHQKPTITAENEKEKLNNQLEQAIRAYDSQNYHEALTYFSALVLQSIAKAQLYLGLMYKHGKGVTQDENQAFIWFEKAAEQGSSGALVQLGLMYEEGKGVEKDEKQAFTYYVKASEQGNVRAQVKLAECYERGIGVTIDKKQAFDWYLKAAEQEDFWAYHIGRIYEKGIGVEEDEKEAFTWYLKAAKQGNADAQYKLGDWYDRGVKGVERDKKKAFNWLLKAAEQGNADAQHTIGGMYKWGIGVEKDEKQAFDWLLKAARTTGYSFYQHSVGEMYESGIGVEKDEKEAFAWYLKASKIGFSGYAEAKLKLAKMYREKGNSYGFDVDPGMIYEREQEAIEEMRDHWNRRP
ncbi:MAG: TIR domain-containing protein [Cyclobacteriaceae bacterium]